MDSKVRIENAGLTDRLASQNLLGHNFEALQFAVDGFMAERLDNPKFLGNTHAQSDVAEGWDSSPSNRFSGFRLELARGICLSGNESQLIHVFHEGAAGGVLQTGRRIYSGERLEVTVWARAQHRPATLEVGIRPISNSQAAYDSKTLTVDTTYWSELKAELYAPVDDDQAAFYCHVKGIGMVWLDQVHLTPAGSDFNDELVEEIKALRIPVLRFPGGCISANYRWKHGTGPRHLRPRLPDPVFRWTMSYEFGCDEYLMLCVEQGITPQIVVNLGTGTPDEAAEWAAYCREWFASRSIDPPEMYWQIGNEQWGGWEIGHMSPKMYADVLRAFVPGIRREYPRARVMALGIDAGGDPYTRNRAPWRTYLLDHVPDTFDILTLHRYHSGKGRKGEICAFVGDLTGAHQAEQMLAEAVEDVRTRGLSKNVALTEWNLWYQAAHHDKQMFYEPYDVQHALFVASMIHMFSRLAPHLELANFYHLINAMGVFRVSGREIEVTPVADVFRLYRPGFPGQVIDMRIETPILPAQSHGIDMEIPAVDAMGLRNDDATRLFIVNRHWDQAFELDLKGFEGGPRLTCLKGDSLRGGFNDSAVSAIRERGSERTAVSVPPLSIVCCEFPND